MSCTSAALAVAFCRVRSVTTFRRAGAHDTKKTRGFCALDTVHDEDGPVMLAKKLSSVDSELPTRPIHPRPSPTLEPVTPVRTHLLLVRSPSPTPRGLAWARRGQGPGFDATRLQTMLRLERLNLG